MKTDIFGALERKSRLTTLLLISVALAVSGCESNPGLLANAVEPAAAIGLSGRWFQDGKATSISVAPDGQHLTITNQYGQKLSGYVDNNHELVISSLGIRGLIRGKVGHGRRRISWSNGVEWTR
jgi:hypothetical protein